MKISLKRIITAPCWSFTYEYYLKNKTARVIYDDFQSLEGPYSAEIFLSRFCLFHFRPEIIHRMKGLKIEKLPSRILLLKVVYYLFSWEAEFHTKKVLTKYFMALSGKELGNCVIELFESR